MEIALLVEVIDKFELHGRVFAVSPFSDSQRTGGLLADNKLLLLVEEMELELSLIDYQPIRIDLHYASAVGFLDGLEVD